MNAWSWLWRAYLICVGLLWSGCAPKESVLIVKLTDWPTEAVKLRILSTFSGQANPAGRTFFVDPGTSEFSVFVPPELSGQAAIEAMAQDGSGCYFAGQIVRARFSESPSIQRVELALKPYSKKQCAVSNATNLKPLLSVWADRSDNAWTVGGAGTILRWDGTAWFSVDSGISIADNIHFVWGSRTATVWAVGGKGLMRVWDGSVMKETPSGSSNAIYSLWGSSDDDVWAVGGMGTILNWNGTSWRNVGSPSYQGSELSPHLVTNSSRRR